MAEYVAELERHLLPSVRIGTQRIEQGRRRAGLSCFGGRPMLPAGMPWPTWHAREFLEADAARGEDLIRAGQAPPAMRSTCEASRARAELGPRPLAFIGQLDLRELREHTVLADVPRGEGLLLFFYDLHESPWGFDPLHRGAARVLHFPGPAREADWPADLPDEARFHECELAFAVEWRLPEMIRPAEGDSLRRALAPGWNHLADCDDGPFGTLYHDLCEARDAVAPMHRFLGPPQAIQNPEMELECQLAANGIYVGGSEGYHSPAAVALAPGAADWRLLLQVDTDEEGPGWMWGDVGRIYFWIRRQDLARMDFSNVWLIFQCS